MAQGCDEIQTGLILAVVRNSCGKLPLRHLNLSPLVLVSAPTGPVSLSMDSDTCNLPDDLAKDECMHLRNCNRTVGFCAPRDTPFLATIVATLWFIIYCTLTKKYFQSKRKELFVDTVNNFKIPLLNKGILKLFLSKYYC